MNEAWLNENIDRQIDNIKNIGLVHILLYVYVIWFIFMIILYVRKRKKN